MDLQHAQSLSNISACEAQARERVLEQQRSYLSPVSTDSLALIKLRVSHNGT
jgi:hypothetical protein